MSTDSPIRTISLREKKEIDALFHAYDEAEYHLCKKRDELFPVGTRVRSRINPDCDERIVGESLYPHQVITKSGHMSWHYLEVLHD